MDCDDGRDAPKRLESIFSGTVIDRRAGKAVQGHKSTRYWHYAQTKLHGIMQEMSK